VVLSSNWSGSAFWLIVPIVIAAYLRRRPDAQQSSKSIRRMEWLLILKGAALSDSKFFSKSLSSIEQKFMARVRGILIDEAFVRHS
jgi:hypothetical protein